MTRTQTLGRPNPAVILRRFEVNAPHSTVASASREARRIKSDPRPRLGLRVNRKRTLGCSDPITAIIASRAIDRLLNQCPHHLLRGVGAKMRQLHRGDAASLSLVTRQMPRNSQIRHASWCRGSSGPRARCTQRIIWLHYREKLFWLKRSAPWHPLSVRLNLWI